MSNLHWQEKGSISQDTQCDTTDSGEHMQTLNPRLSV